MVGVLKRGNPAWDMEVSAAEVAIRALATGHFPSTNGTPAPEWLTVLVGRAATPGFVIINLRIHRYPRSA